MYKVIVKSLSTGDIVDTIVSEKYPTKICWDIELSDFDKKCEIITL